MVDDDFELPELPVIDKGPPPECPMCGDPMGFHRWRLVLCGLQWRAVGAGNRFDFCNVEL